ncbi:MAG TPA: hypothetical protein VGG20_15355 [Thermoanaerobaculia bacterium]|jgi:hypothetical protein
MADSFPGTAEPSPSRRRVLVWGSLIGALVVVLAASLWLSGAIPWFHDEPLPETVQKPRPVRHPQAEPLLAVAPAGLPVAVRDRYRPRPDRRLLLAVAEVQRLRKGTPPEPVQAEFQDGKWRLLSGQDEVGTLSEIPSFDEATDLLARWAARWPPPAAAGSAGHPEIAGDALDRAVREVDAAALLTALSKLGADAQGDEARVRSTTAGLAWLSTLTVDPLDQADPLLAEAWAWLALERGSAMRGVAGDEVLIARALGYEGAAARAASKLAVDDPLRLYAAGDEARLGTLCAARPADRPCHFLRLALLAERHQSERFRAAILASPFKGETSLAARGLETRLADYETELASGRDLAALAFLASGGKGEMKSLLGLNESSVEARTRDFETAVGSLSSGNNSGAIDAAALPAGYRAAFYSGLFQEATYVVEHIASGPAARHLAELLATPAAGTAAELRRWIELKGQALDGARDSRPLVEFMESARSIGPAPLAELAVVIKRQSESTEPLRRRPIPALFARLDTRPSHLVIAARAAEGSLNSPALFETFARAAAEGAPHLSEELPARAAELSEDSVRLREIADDPAMPQSARAMALAAMAKLDKADGALVRARYEELAADPDQGPDLLVWLLEKNGDLRGALAAEEAAIRRGSYHGALALAHLQTEKARLQLALGDPEGAFRTIEPAIEQYKEETLQQAATIELARHHPENALKLAQAALERYPRNASDTSGLIARARWQLGDDATAAKELAANRNGLLAAWNRYLPESFAEAFATAPEDSVRRAFSEMVAAGIAPNILARAAIALGEKRGLAITMPLLAGLHDPAPEWRDAIRLATYDLILEKSGKDAALDWVKKGMADRPHNFALALYQMRKYELLLGLYPEGQESMKPGLIRMLKAASLLHLRETRGPRWDGVVAEVAKDPGDDFFARGARYLTGRIDAAEILRHPLLGRGELASLGWLMGVKAASERRFADADGWFQVAVESGQEQQPPLAWSWLIEVGWQKVNRSLTVLEKKGDF